jgi:hypothetical protein
MSEAAATNDSSQQSAKGPTIDAFRARCEARALLVGRGQMNLIDAVDDLQADAERDGLVTRYGQDEVQFVLANAFGSVRRV